MGQKAALIAVVSAVVTALALEYADLVSALWLPAADIIRSVAESR